MITSGKCPNCGASVRKPGEDARIQCDYCKSEITLQEAVDELSRIRSSTIGGALLIAETAQEGGGYEEALNFYNKVIEQDPNHSDAWLNKGICMIRTSKIGDIKFAEAIGCWKIAIKVSKKPDAMRRRVALEVLATVQAFSEVLIKHYAGGKTLKGSLLKDVVREHALRIISLASALKFAQEMDPQNESIADWGHGLCKNVSKEVASEMPFTSSEICKSLDDLADAFMAAFKQANPQGYKRREEMLEDKSRKEREQLILIGIWIMRVLGPLVLCSAFFVSRESTSGLNNTGKFFVFVAIVMTVLGFWPSLAKGKVASKGNG